MADSNHHALPTQNQMHALPTSSSRTSTPSSSRPSSPISKFCFGLDIGGTLCKIVCFEKRKRDGESSEDTSFRKKLHEIIDDGGSYGETGRRDKQLEFEADDLQGRVYLARFETRKMEHFLDMVWNAHIVTPATVICSTGGGARKYKQRLFDLFGVELPKTDELQCLVDGTNFMMAHDDSELYCVEDPATYVDTGRTVPLASIYGKPYLLVNIGSGVSILKVCADGTHQRVGGTSLGGATFLGLACMLTDSTSFDEAMELAERGHSENVDLLVGDIYGGDYDEYGLSASTVAASLGKLIRPRERQNARPEDIARGLLEAFTNNIGSLAMLHAKQQDVEHVMFAGNFLRRNRLSIARLSFAMNYWSKGKVSAVFLKHEGYLGAMGAMLYGAKHHTHPSTGISSSSSS